MSPRSGWLLVNEIVPRLRSAVPLVAHCVGAEDPEELIGDATLHAARILHSAEGRGRKITPGNACYYAIQHTKSGRRSVGNSSVDVMAACTQLNGRSRLESLETVVASNEECGGEIFELHDVLSSYDAEDPSMAAARKLDWQDLYAQLPRREKAIITLMVQGKSGSAIARKLKVTVSAIQTGKRHLAKAIVEFMGPDILTQVRRLPRWKDCINATREKIACRERRHL